MTDPAAPAVSDKNVFERAIGVVLSPRSAYAAVAAYPRVLWALVIVVAVLAGAQAAFSATSLGRDLMIEQGVRMLEGFRIQITDQVYAAIEQQANQPWYRSAIGSSVFLTIAATILAGIIFAVFNAIMGGEARFKQVFAVVVHSGFLLAVQTLFIYPMFYMKQSMASPTSLAVFLPNLDDTSFIGRLIGGVDLFRLWWIVNLAIGVGVLYKRRTSPIVTSMLIVYALIVVVVAAIGAALGA